MIVIVNDITPLVMYAHTNARGIARFSFAARGAWILYGRAIYIVWREYTGKGRCMTTEESIIVAAHRLAEWAECELTRETLADLRLQAEMTLRLIRVAERASG